MNIIEVARQVILEAGELLRSGFGKTLQIEQKEGNQNLVTEYDLACQELIIRKIKSAFPHHHFVAEEGVFPSPSADQTVWIIDPLDGTVNFVHSLPFFAISIAVAKGKELLAGLVYNPMIQELFIAEKGSGAFLNGAKLQVSKQSSLKSSCLATGFPYNIETNPLHCIEHFTKILSLGAPIRRLGAASLDISYVAAGRFDGFWEVGLHPWDIAAGKLLVEEAGGKVSSYDGLPHPLFGYVPFIASNGLIHDALLQHVNEEIV